MLTAQLTVVFRMIDLFICHLMYNKNLLGHKVKIHENEASASRGQGQNLWGRGHKIWHRGLNIPVCETCYLRSLDCSGSWNNRRQADSPTPMLWRFCLSRPPMKLRRATVIPLSVCLSVYLLRGYLKKLLKDLNQILWNDRHSAKDQMIGF